MKTEEKIVKILKEDDLDIIEVLELLQKIENVFIETLKENIDSKSIK